MGMSRAEFARSIDDPDKMLSYIDTGIAYINACKTRINIEMMKLQLGWTAKKEFNENVKEYLKKIIYEAGYIHIYLNSEPFKKKFLELPVGEQSKEITMPKEVKEMLLNPDLQPQLVEQRLSELFEEIKELINYQEYKDLFKLTEKNDENI